MRKEYGTVTVNGETWHDASIHMDVQDGMIHVHIFSDDLDVVVTFKVPAPTVQS